MFHPEAQPTEWTEWSDTEISDDECWKNNLQGSGPNLTDSKLNKVSLTQMEVQTEGTNIT